MATSATVAGRRPSLYIRQYVWQLPIRLVHWSIVASVAVLAFTGSYIHSPFLLATGKPAYVMGTVRYIHMLAGFVLLSAYLWRVCFFFAANEWANWKQYVPTTKARFVSMATMFKYYTFQRWWPVTETGHNGLAGFAYGGLYTLILTQIVTGFALLDHVGGNDTLHRFIGWLPWLIDIQYLRLIHFFAMFLFLVFFISHLYIATIVSKEEKAGLFESIVTGFKYIQTQEDKSARK